MAWVALLAFTLGACSGSESEHATAALPTASPQQQGVSAERLAALDALAERYVDDGRVAGMVNIVLRNGQVVYFKATGSRSLGGRTALRTSDLFRIYSMTKPITAVAAMQLYEQGGFHLSDPVKKFIPELAELQVLQADGQRGPLERPITMHDLLTHTAGFSYGFLADADAVDAQYAAANLWAAEDLDEFAQRVAKLPLRFQPGSRYHYSIAVDLTGLVVQRISGVPFAQYLEENIFAPLGMADTFFAVPKAKRHRFLPNYYYDNSSQAPVNVNAASAPLSPTSGVAMRDYEEVGLYSGGGGLVSTAMDYARFAEALRNGGSLDGVRILAPATVAYMSTNHLPAGAGLAGFGEQPGVEIADSGLGFGLGFGVLTSAVTNKVIGSVGEYNWGGAAGRIFWVDPVEELVAVSMIQLMNSPWPLRADVKVAVYQALDDIYAQ
ncbi:MAG: serine hydrolase [Proteobacteria bacterium]|nr:serine hydrolase [Pseudomonadota bacterium]